MINKVHIIGEPYAAVDDTLLSNMILYLGCGCSSGRGTYTGRNDPYAVARGYGMSTATAACLRDVKTHRNGNCLISGRGIG